MLSGFERSHDSRCEKAFGGPKCGRHRFWDASAGHHVCLTRELFAAEVAGEWDAVRSRVGGWRAGVIDHGQLADARGGVSCHEGGERSRRIEAVFEQG